MPFDLFVSRAGSFASIDKSGWFRRQRPISREEFLGVLSGSRAGLQPSGDLWVQHPQDGSPWFATRLTEMGSMILSCSYSNHRYVRNFVDALDLGVQIAESLRANLFEEVRGELVTRQSLDQLVDLKSSYVELQVGTFHSAVEKLDADPGGPLEYPLGPVDIVGEYFVLHHTLPETAPATVPELLSRLSLTSVPARVEASNAILVSASGQGLCKVLLRTDRKLQLWPSHGQAPFSECAAATLEVVEGVMSLYPGSTTLHRHPLTPELYGEVKERAKGLGVEFYQWYLQYRAAA